VRHPSAGRIRRVRTWSWLNPRSYRRPKEKLPCRGGMVSALSCEQKTCTPATRWIGLLAIFRRKLRVAILCSWSRDAGELTPDTTQLPTACQPESLAKPARRRRALPGPRRHLAAFEHAAWRSASLIFPGGSLAVPIRRRPGSCRTRITCTRVIIGLAPHVQPYGNHLPLRASRTRDR
jgi:hypothetical protein